ncbi:hypothetical protein C8J55DRAFT_549770, partial [Lentinula edodes]
MRLGMLGKSAAGAQGKLEVIFTILFALASCMMVTFQTCMCYSPPPSTSKCVSDMLGKSEVTPPGDTHKLNNQQQIERFMFQDRLDHPPVSLLWYSPSHRERVKPESSAGHLARMQTLIAFLCGGVRRFGRASSMNSLHLGLGFRVEYTGYFVDLHLIISTISIDTNWGSVQVVGLMVIRVWLGREVEEKE